MNTVLPTYKAAAQAVLTETATPLDVFIYEEQPCAVHEEEFRQNLTNLVAFYREEVRKAEQAVIFFTSTVGVVGIIAALVVKQLS